MLPSSINGTVKAVPVVTYRRYWEGYSGMDFQGEKGTLGLHNWHHQVPQIIVTTAKFMN